MIEKIMSKGMVGPNGCIVWRGAVTPSGYGSIKFQGKVWQVHRLVYFLVNGNLPNSEIVHSCKNKLCINPDHLTEGNQLNRSVEERFWSFVDKSGDCWEWQGAIIQNTGYGQFYLNDKHRSYKAHRLAWEIANKKPVPDGLIICHRCDNRKCVNPSHLYAGTYTDNNRDIIKRNRRFPSSEGRQGRKE